MQKITSEPDRMLRSATLATLFGAIDYALLPELFHVSREGTADEISAIYAATAGAILGSVSPIRKLCQERQEDLDVRTFNVIKGGSAGSAGGLGITFKTSAPLLSLVDMGIIAVCTVLGTGSVAIYNHLKQPKYCTNFQCQKKGNCSQKVCRFCQHLFVPKEGKIDCSQTLILDWYTIASFFQRQGLSYLDSEALVREKLSDWSLVQDDDSVKVDCEFFLEWVHTHKTDILAYKGKGMNGRSDDEVVTYLEKKGL